MDVAQKETRHTLIAGVVATLLFVGGLVCYEVSQQMLTAANDPIEEQPVEVSISAKKREIISIITTRERLSPSERRRILNDVAGAKFAEYRFTTEEKVRLLSVLNRE